MSRICAIVVLFIVSAQVAAQSLGHRVSRAGDWEVGFLVNYVDSFDIQGRNNSTIDVDSDVGFGISFGYHINDYFQVSFDFAHNEQDYDALIFADETGQSPYMINHALTNDSFGFNGTYHFFPSTFTPFVTAGIGWNYLDSNINSGDGGDLVCWWDPWWGYVCDEYYSSYTDNAFSYGIGAGLRWEVARNFVMKASINQRWLDVDTVGDTPEMMVGKIEFIWTAW